jgi:leucyl aminopeptidase (aminopeptidase T)
VARTALKVLIEKGMIENAAEMGAHFLEGLREIRNPLIKEIRGIGLMMGIEFFPEAGGVRPYCERLMAKGMLCKDTHEHTIRIAPPLVITRDEVDWALVRTIGRPDYAALQKMATRLYELSQAVETVRVTSPAGTDTTMRVDKAGDPFWEPPPAEGGFPQMLGGQSGFMIYRESVEGTLVFDGALWPPVELGLGTNPNARRPDHVPEAEKIKGTVHFAIGDNLHMGGEVESDTQEDFIQPEPDLPLDGRPVIVRGEWWM